MISIKSLILTVFVTLFALGAHAEQSNNRVSLDELRQLNNEMANRNLAEAGASIYAIIRSALDLAEDIATMCLEQATNDPAVLALCDRAL